MSTNIGDESRSQLTHVLFNLGYGNISPNNTFGRIFIIFYALVGLPVNAVLFAYLGDYFGKTVSGLIESYGTSLTFKSQLE